MDGFALDGVVVDGVAFDGLDLVGVALDGFATGSPIIFFRLVVRTAPPCTHSDLCMQCFSEMLKELA